MRKRTTIGMVGLGLGLGLLLGHVLGGGAAAASMEEPAQVSARALLEERQQIYDHILRYTEHRAEEGGASQEDVRAVHIEVLQSRLELCATREERVEILEKIVKVFRDRESHLEAAMAAGRVGAVEAMRARIDRIDAQIALAREREGD